MELKMTETPKCPGCGSEMKAVDFDREHLNFSFFCYECGWGSPLRDTAEEALSAALHRAEPDKIYQQLSKAKCGKENATLGEILEAAEQLKKRAEPELRPLTLEEISEKAYNTDWDFVWLETKGDIFQLQLCPRYVNEEVLGFCWPLSDDEIEANVEKMGKSWRCWPRKPTTEQMVAEKWEE